VPQVAVARGSDYDSRPPPANTDRITVSFTEQSSMAGPSAAALKLTVNGKAVSADVDPRTLLVEFLRGSLGLTGTHVGCDTGQCGACTVHLDGRAVKSCTVLALQANGASVLTIEGLAAPDGTLHPMQAAFKECHGLQCGFCTPGMVLSAIDLVRCYPGADEATIREQLDGNLCRCTGYRSIVRAVRLGDAAMTRHATGETIAGAQDSGAIGTAQRA
jgi:aerobic carbon-monoxide dehydrogenase small subunit